MDNDTDLEGLAHMALDLAIRAGAGAADVLVAEGSHVEIDVRDSRLERAERAEGIEIGLRVILGQRQACISVSDTSEGAVAEAARRAVAMAEAAPDDPWIGLAREDELAVDWDADFLDMADRAAPPAPADLEEAARRAEAAARAHAGISKIDSANAAWGRRRTHLAATNGFSGGYTRTGASLSCVAITGEGTAMERDWMSDSRIYLADLMSPEEVGRIAAERTLARAGARKPPTGRYPVLLDERVAGSLIGHLLQAANGRAVARKSSWLIGRLGQQVLPEGLTLYEDPLRARVAGSHPFDAEGLPSIGRNIVSEGRLVGWTLDLATARQLSMPPTGNAARGTGGPPSPAVSNVALTQGSASREDLIAGMGTGLYVTSFLGATINPNTGDYSRGASGFWVENGRISYPVNECTIAGTLPEMLLSLTPANDARLHLPYVVPSLLLSEMTVAGS